MPLIPGARPWPASTLYQDVLLRPRRKCNPAFEAPPPWASLLFASSHTQFH